MHIQMERPQIPLFSPVERNIQLFTRLGSSIQQEPGAHALDLTPAGSESTQPIVAVAPPHALQTLPIFNIITVSYVVNIKKNIIYLFNTNEYKS